jgi:ribosomal protein S18 acetylase RimI-like enzyme
LLGLAEYTALFNAAYEGYLIPFHLDENTTAAMIEAFDLDADASRIAFRDGGAVGLGNLGVRGDDAWIGGVGVVTAARRTGVGEALMRALHEQGRERGIRRVWLEVIVENTGAFALYEKLGYRTLRDVEVWSLSAAEDDEPTAREVPAAEAHEKVRERRTEREPWQRAENVQLLQIAGDAEPLLRRLRSLGPVSILNLPDDDPAATAFRSLGATVVVRQHEMLLEL